MPPGWPPRRTAESASGQVDGFAGDESGSDHLHEAGRRWIEHGTVPRTRALVVTEVALAFVLLTFAGLLLQSFVRLQDVDPGFHAEHVLTASMPIPQHRFTEPEAMHVYRRQMRRATKVDPLIALRSE